MKKGYKRGFTLVEVLATVTLLGILIALSYPKIMEQLEKQNNNISDAKKKLIYSAVNTYISNNEDTYPIREGKIYCIPVNDLTNDNLVAIDVSDLDFDLVVKISITDTKNYDLVKTSKCVENR